MGERVGRCEKERAKRRKKRRNRLFPKGTSESKKGCTPGAQRMRSNVISLSSFLLDENDFWAKFDFSFFILLLALHQHTHSRLLTSRLPHKPFLTNCPTFPLSNPFVLQLPLSPSCPSSSSSSSSSFTLPYLRTWPTTPSTLILTPILTSRSILRLSTRSWHPPAQPPPLKTDLSLALNISAT